MKILIHPDHLMARSGRLRTVPVLVTARNREPAGVFTPKILAFANRKVGSQCKPQNTRFFSANRDDREL